MSLIPELENLYLPYVFRVYQGFDPAPVFKDRKEDLFTIIGSEAPFLGSLHKSREFFSLESSDLALASDFIGRIDSIKDRIKGEFVILSSPDTHISKYLLSISQDIFRSASPDNSEVIVWGGFYHTKPVSSAALPLGEVFTDAGGVPRTDDEFRNLFLGTSDPILPLRLVVFRRSVFLNFIDSVKETKDLSFETIRSKACSSLMLAHNLKKTHFTIKPMLTLFL